MNLVLEWVKSNVFIVVFAVLMIAALITLPLIASGMNDDVADEVDRRARKLNELARLEQTQVSPPGGAATGESQPALVNERFLQNFRSAVRIAQEDAELVHAAALEHNRKGRGIIMANEPIFPAPPRGREEVLPWRFYEAAREAYEELFDEINAGTPPDLESLRDDIERREVQFRTQTLSKDADDPLTEEERRELRDVLSGLRLLRYEEAAERISMYASTDVLQLPAWQEGTLPSLARMFEWQWRYWIHTDVLRALASANENSPSVIDAPVKRVLSLGVSASPARSDDGPGAARGTAMGGGGGAGGVRGGAPNPSAEAPLDFSVSFTGRTTNPLYDVRYVDLDVIVDTNRIPEVLDALARYNFMTVISMRTRPADPYLAAASGYFYGSSPVSLLSMRLETVWFREWTSEFMPESVKSALGIASGTSGGGGDDINF